MYADFRIQRYLVRQWIQTYVSLQRLFGDFTHGVREGGLGPCGPQGLLCLSLCNGQVAADPFGPFTLLVTMHLALCSSMQYTLFPFVCRDRYAQCKLCNFLLGPRMLTCPLLCSTDARFRCAGNCGAPQLQFFDQVESSLFGNRHLSAQCNCAVCSWQGGVLWSADALFLGPSQVQGRGGGHVHRDISPP